jgi:hypothetical protein
MLRRDAGSAPLLAVKFPNVLKAFYAWCSTEYLRKSVPMVHSNDLPRPQRSMLYLLHSMVSKHQHNCAAVPTRAIAYNIIVLVSSCPVLVRCGHR